MSEERMLPDHKNAQLDGAHTHGKGAAPIGSRADRLTSFDLADIPVPHGREEDWRFTPMKRIRPLFEADYATSSPRLQVSAPAEVTVDSVGRDKEETVRVVAAPEDRTAVTAWANWTETVIIDIPADSELSEPIRIQVQDTGEEACAGSLLVRAGARSNAVVVLEHYGHGIYNETVQVESGDDSNLTFVTTQEWDDTSIHAANHRLSAGHGARLKHIVVTLGGDLVRVCTDGRFSAPGANVELLGLYFTDAGQHQEHRLFVDHSTTNCISRVTYKGALQGKNAHAVWVGDVLIGKDAFGTDTYELNRNLVLTEGARADSVPNLEIENGEIEGAGHASATGRFDDEQLFYLCSRGIPEDIARRLVVRGFFAELISQIGVPSVTEHLMEKIEEELSQTEKVVQAVKR